MQSGRLGAWIVGSSPTMTLGMDIKLYFFARVSDAPVTGLRPPAWMHFRLSTPRAPIVCPRDHFGSTSRAFRERGVVVWALARKRGVLNEGYLALGRPDSSEPPSRQSGQHGQDGQDYAPVPGAAVALRNRELHEAIQSRPCADMTYDKEVGDVTDAIWTRISHSASKT